MELEFRGEIWFWKGPAPWYFVTIPAAESENIKAIAKHVTYGWGVIPVNAKIGNTGWKTSLFPKDDCYVVPIKTVVRKAEQLDVGDQVTIRLVIG